MVGKTKNKEYKLGIYRHPETKCEVYAQTASIAKSLSEAGLEFFSEFKEKTDKNTKKTDETKKK